MPKVFLAVFLCTFLLPLSKKASNTQGESEQYIVESERQWAESVASGDTAVVERILANDFLGVAPDGTLFDKAKEIADTRQDAKDYVSNHINEVKVRFFGDTAIAQGSESWERRTEEPKRGRYVWTDTWIRRKGQWQIVASQDLIVAETK